MAEKILDFFTQKVTDPSFQQSPRAPGAQADAAFLSPFFGMPNQTPTNQSVATPPPAQTPTQTATQQAPATAPPVVENVAPPTQTDQSKVEESFGIKQEDTAPVEKESILRFGVNGAFARSNQNQAIADMMANGATQTEAVDALRQFISEGGEDEIKGFFGLDIPTSERDGVSEMDKLKQKQEDLMGLDRRAELREQFDSEVKNIRATFDTRREQLATDVENSRMAQVSSLNSIGVVNPLSSGLASIGTASKDYLDKHNTLLDQAEAQERSRAYAQFFDKDTTEINRGIELINKQIEDLNTEAQLEYENKLASYDRSMQRVDKLVSIWKENNRVDEAAQDDARVAFSDIVKDFGSAAFNGMTPEALADMEGALGYPTGVLKSGIEALKKAELKDPNYELRSVDGSLYSITTDENGNPVPTLLIAKPRTASGSLSSLDKNVKAMFSDADALRKDIANKSLDWGQAWNRLKAQYPDVGNDLIDSALGGSAGYDASTGSFDSSKATGYAKEGSKEIDSTKLSDDAVRNYIATSVEGKGKNKKINTEKIPSDVRTEVINRATALGIFGQ